MKELVVSPLEAGQRFDKYLIKCMTNASKSFLYKMLRKKNILLNGKKADGSEKISSGDCVKVFFSDETFEKFTGNPDSVNGKKYAKELSPIKLSVLYENREASSSSTPTGRRGRGSSPITSRRRGRG